MPKQKRKENQILVNEDFPLIVTSAVRYALGRRTYIVGTVCRFVSGLLQELDDTTLYVLDQDITEQKYFGGYGDTCDRAEWLNLQKLVKEELHRRGKDEYKTWRMSDATPEENL